MRRTILISLLFVLAAPLFADDEADLRRLTQEQLDAIAPGRVEVWQELEHLGFADRREGIDVRWTKVKEQ